MTLNPSTLSQPNIAASQPATTLPCILLCPGQGAQHVGMGKSWFDRYTVASETFKEADRILEIPLTEYCFNGPEETLNRTDISQAAIYATTVACYRALTQDNRLGRGIMAAGLSLGEFTALHLAGAFDFETGLRLVRLRGQAMQEASEAAPSGMVALVGADEDQARQLCEKVLSGGADVLVAANFNCPGQIVLSGSKTACERALTVASEMGLKATPLKVAGAFHSPLMKPAAEKLAKALDEVKWGSPTLPVMSNVTAALHEINKPDSIKQRLIEQLTSPVRWEQSLAWLTAHVPGQFVELAPGRVLSGHMKRINRAVKVENFAEAS